MRPEAVDEFPRNGGQCALRRVESRELEVDARLERTDHDAARGVLGRGEGLAESYAGA